MLEKIRHGSTYKPIIIFGSSPQINDVKERIPALQKKYTNIGINSFPVSYPDVDYWALLDRVTLMHTVNKNTYKGQCILTEYSYKASGLLKHYENSVVFMKDVDEKFMTDKKVFDNSIVVSGCVITLTYVINWCYLMGYTDIYLIGHTLSDTWNHFDSSFVVEHDDLRMNDIREFVREASKFINIYQTDRSYEITGIEFKDIEDIM